MVIILVLNHVDHHAREGQIGCPLWDREKYISTTTIWKFLRRSGAITPLSSNTLVLLLLLLYIYIGVIGPRVHIYVYIGPGTQSEDIK